PDARYFSIPATPVGGVAVSTSALNCSPCSRSETQAPVAVTHSSAPMAGVCPTHGDQIAFAARLHLEDTKAILTVVKSDPFDRTGDSLSGLCRCLCRPLHQRHVS